MMYLNFVRVVIGIDLFSAFMFFKVESIMRNFPEGFPFWASSLLQIGMFFIGGFGLYLIHDAVKRIKGTPTTQVNIGQDVYDALDKVINKKS